MAIELDSLDSYSLAVYLTVRAIFLGIMDVFIHIYIYIHAYVYVYLYISLF